MNKSRSISNTSSSSKWKDGNNVLYYKSSNVSIGKETNSGYMLDISGNVAMNGLTLSSTVKPRYVSPNWISVVLATTYDINHNLNMNLSEPLRFTAFFSQTNNPVIGTNVIFELPISTTVNVTTGISLNYQDANKFRIRTGSSQIYVGHNSTYLSATTGYIKFYVW